MNLYRWRLARSHGIAWTEIKLALGAYWDVLWLCRARRLHQEKMGSYGHCYRCGKAMR